MTSAIIAAEEMVDQGVNGYIVDPASIGDLTKRLAGQAADPSLRVAQGTASRQRASAYQPELVVDALEVAYQDLVPANRCI